MVKKVDFKINQREQSALKGLPYLPRLAYLEAIRPYMDYATGIVGIKRGISYQSLREELYVEPHRGYASGAPSKDQMRRALKTLARAGLLSIHSEDKKLILKCELASADYSVQNKVATKAPQQSHTPLITKNKNETARYSDNNEKADTTKLAKAATPPESGINIIFLEHAFEKFWLMYPNKQSKIQAWKIFQSLSPDAQLFDAILNALKKQCDVYNCAVSTGQWVPNWKNAGNWLAQHCWNEPLFEIQTRENHHERTTKNYSKQSHSNNLLWESCKAAFNTDSNNEQHATVIDFEKYRQNTN